ncbi:hypothetical protein [Helicobacter heilmannii]|uniref:Putative n=1 Tax=Helicobacter heilmannii TaxID=35817 RepID=A0A0K2YA64_HELHE|nr:hypothetical protein [Helicobacter heilmannii]BDQ26691.1 hypothetical protein ASB1_03670 [Helicobacter heilmannii]CRI34594.1 putative [Helicobacter heilmannii]
MCSYLCALLLLGFNVLCALGVFWRFQGLGVLSFEVAFLSFLLILLAGYKQLKNKLQTAKEPTPSKFFAFGLGVQISLGWLKILSYGVFLGGLFGLLHAKLLMPIAYFVGLGACLVGVLLLQALKRAKS